MWMSEKDEIYRQSSLLEYLYQGHNDKMFGFFKCLRACV